MRPRAIRFICFNSDLCQISLNLNKKMGKKSKNKRDKLVSRLSYLFDIDMVIMSERQFASAHKAVQ